ncbi:ATP-binding protein [Planctomyces sp. SH-PL14]|uniref:ATP-binding protein n=1 Tax=Planctomyces sp. SH-PL14 TaxID=1632864 RepID=UPI00078C0782|nr:ATP-binding protein [Planctomyces sp. SH-PL14]AMV18253.1 Divergent AAA domain protein [Planctomyces sp. SH-PL14]
MKPSAADLLNQLNETDEHRRVEAKSSLTELGDAVLETICAYSNEPGLQGGFLMLGVAQSPSTLFPTYDVCDLEDPDATQSILATRCRTEFNVTIRPQIAVEIVRNKRVVVAYVPEVSANEKPVFIKKLGLHKGAYRRIGPTDQLCTEDDFCNLFQSRKPETFDQQVVNATVEADLDPEAIQRVREAVQKNEPDAECVALPDPEFLVAMGAAKVVESKTQATLSGLMVCGKRDAIRRCMPMVRVDYIRTASTRWMENPDALTECTSFASRLPDVISRVHAAILADLPVQHSLEDGAVERTETRAIPSRVVREAVVNAVMHRDYRTPGPVQVIRYPNRLEIRNPGFSLKSDDQFSMPGSMPRNPAISSLLHDLRLAETRGMGLGIMTQAMNSIGMYAPFFDSDRSSNMFSAFFVFHRVHSPESDCWIKSLGISFPLTEHDKQALVFAREMGGINMGAYRSISGLDSLQSSRRLRLLRDAGILRLKGQTRKYYVLEEKVGSSDGKVGSSTPKSGEFAPKVGSSNGVTEDDFSEVPDVVWQKIGKLGGRASASRMQRAILELCAWRPLMPAEIAKYLDRTSVKRLVASYITPMVESGLLERTIPDILNHPAQRYRPTTQGLFDIL